MNKAKRNRLEVLQSDPQEPRDEDKRVFCRFALPDVPMRFKDLKVGDRGVAVCKDISGGGVGLECSQQIKPRTPIEMWLDLPDGHDPLHLLGKAVWSKEAESNWRVGVSFVRPKLMELSRILRLEPARGAL